MKYRHALLSDYVGIQHVAATMANSDDFDEYKDHYPGFLPLEDPEHSLCWVADDPLVGIVGFTIGQHNPDHDRLIWIGVHSDHGSVADIGLKLLMHVIGDLPEGRTLQGRIDQQALCCGPGVRDKWIADGATLSDEPDKDGLITLTWTKQVGWVAGKGNPSS